MSLGFVKKKQSKKHHPHLCFQLEINISKILATFVNHNIVIGDCVQHYQRAADSETSKHDSESSILWVHLRMSSRVINNARSPEIPIILQVTLAPSLVSLSSALLSFTCKD